MTNLISRIDQYNKLRDPDFLELKYKAMRENPFRFFRGSCHLFYEDLSKNTPFEDPTKTWICGDLHLENYGSYKAANSQVYFDVVDFDEAILAPVSWEILRTLTSIYLAVDSLGLPLKSAEGLATTFFKTFHDVIMSGKPVAFERNTVQGLIRRFIKSVEKRKSKDLLSERTEVKGSKILLKIIEGKTVKIMPEEKKSITELVSVWADKHKHQSWKVYDAAHRIAGTGSLGLDRYVLLVKDKALKKYFLLDMKESITSCLKPYIEILQPEWKNNAKRITGIQNLMQNVSPPVLETLIYKHKPFVLKKLQPQADMMNLKLCKGNIQKLLEVIETFAEISASAHLRATGRFGSGTTDELIAFFQTSSDWKSRLLKYSKKYAEQVRQDYFTFCQH
ncbi:DUF2252 domain-containing protein [Dyadobacter frigoris]|uniref:DUF2252 domain-containing protein n=1 Tax=Dyadobacter frigoris TaxID=2576211 RepID=A0A4U6CXN6_9BACT|nr:DUF2252 family protein [Dyadobacter frigoris]TKT87988.1 DUF2252 domain-containing protein [Dyadobacter frigoris]